MGSRRRGGCAATAPASRSSSSARRVPTRPKRPRSAPRRQPLSAEIGYWLIERARGRGLGSRAVALVARWAVTEAGLARVEALVEPENIASQRVLEKAGFRREGHLRSYLVFERRRADAYIYSLLPNDLGLGGVSPGS